MEIGHAIIYGIVEGITEFLPISSTGHLMLTAKLLGDESTDMLKSFEIMIQLGAILAIVALYPKRLLLDRQTILRVLAAFIPTAILGLLFYKLIKMYLLGNIAIVLAALVIGGVVMIYLEKKWHVRGTSLITDLTFTQSAMLGVLQTIAFIPGISRSAMTIFGGMFFGLTRKEAVEFSFFLAVPTMAAATALDLLKNYNSFGGEDINFLAVGFITSFIVALLCVRWLSRYIATHDFTTFGYYRIIVGIVGYFLFFY